MSGTDLEVVEDHWLAGWNGAEADGFAECCTADVSYEDPVLTQPVDGPDALRRHVARIREALPDLRVERSGPRIQTGVHTCMPFRALGTHTGEVAAVPATGRFVVVQGVHFAELRDGRIRRARGFFDLYDAGAQLGLLPARGGLGEAALLMLRGFGLRSTR